MAIYVPGYPQFGGTQINTAPIRNVIIQAGLNNPATQAPLTEAMIVGLSGGIGFRYTGAAARSAPCPLLSGHFEPPRHDPLCRVLDRLGVRTQVHETGSRRSAQQTLMSALQSGTPALCVVSTAHLPHHGRPADSRRLPHQLVAVVGVEGEQVFVDDVCDRSIPMGADQFLFARSALRRLRHRQYTITSGLVGGDRLARFRVGIRSALRDTCQLFLQPPNRSYGLPAIRKWAEMLCNDRHRTGWMRLLEAPRRLYAALWRAYEGLCCGWSSPGATRPLYADFLVESAAILERPQLLQAAGLYRLSGDLWCRLCDLLLPEEIPALRRCRWLTERRQGLLRTQAHSASGEMRSLWAARDAIGHRFRGLGSFAERRFRFRAMAQTLTEIEAVEGRALGLLSTV